MVCVGSSDSYYSVVGAFSEDYHFPLDRVGACSQTNVPVETHRHLTDKPALSGLPLLHIGRGRRRIGRFEHNHPLQLPNMGRAP